MIECGIVHKIQGDTALVTVVKGEQCKGCTACDAFGEGSSELLVQNDLSAKVGDRVEVEIDPKQVMRHSAIVFLLPVFSLILGYFLGVNYLTKIGLADEGAGIIGSLGLMVLTFVGIVFYDRIVGKSNEINTRIIRIL